MGSDLFNIGSRKGAYQQGMMSQLSNVKSAGNVSQPAWFRTSTAKMAPFWAVSRQNAHCFRLSSARGRRNPPTSSTVWAFDVEKVSYVQTCPVGPIPLFGPLQITGDRERCARSPLGENDRQGLRVRPGSSPWRACHAGYKHPFAKRNE